jgi:hypothetical protein
MATMASLVTAEASEPVADALRRAQPFGFDYLPVTTQQGGAIVGLLEVVRAARADHGAPVSALMDPLSASNLIGADAPLLSFVCAAHQHPCRLVLDGTAISGIVTLSDLPRLPVRTAIFGLFIHLEMFLTQMLRDLRVGGDDPIAALREGSRGRARKRWERRERQRTQRDQFDVMLFAEKRALAVDHGALETVRDRLELDLKLIEELRNPIAHGNDFAVTREEARRTAATVWLLREWTIWFRDWRGRGLTSPPPPPPSRPEALTATDQSPGASTGG